MRYSYEHPRLSHERDPVLTDLLARRGMLTYLARELGVGKNAVSMWRKIPEHHIGSISKLLGVPKWKLRGEKRTVRIIE